MNFSDWSPLHIRSSFSGAVPYQRYISIMEKNQDCHDVMCCQPKPLYVFNHC